MFYVVFVLVLAFLGTWNSSPFLESIEEMNVWLKSAISIGLLGGIPALVVVIGGMFDAFVASRRLSGRR